MRNIETVKTIDCNYVYPDVAAAFLIVEGDRAAFVENNTAKAVPLLLKALEENSLTPEQVDYLIITHVHLDHAGGTAELLKHCPNATVICHPRAARHVIDPTRLVASATMVYGEEPFKEMYGEIVGVPEDRVQIKNDGEEIQFGSRTLKFIHTRGHANHHFVIHDSGTNGIFTGDAFGIAYPYFGRLGAPILYPSSTPTDFDAEEARLSVDKIIATGAGGAYMTHMGLWTDMDRGAEMMKVGLDALEAIQKEATESDLTGDALQKFCEEGVENYLIGEFEKCAIELDDEEKKLLKLDISINAMGLAFVAMKARKKLKRG